MRKSLVIDSLPESVYRYQAGWAVVAVDVIRATTTAITAVATGRRCFPAPTIDAALALAQAFKDPLLAGESGGTVPVGFEIDNSPAELIRRTDINRPLVLVSSSGTKVIHEAAGCDATYLSCFRNYSTLATHLSNHHSRVAIIGAGSKGEFREEDQMCCAWLATGLMRNGYRSENAQTDLIASRWRDAPPNACLCSHSVDFLKRTGRLADLEFILAHIDDIRGVFAVRNGEVKMIAEGQAVSASPLRSSAGLQKPSQPIALP
jgi:2-phosphosulfolactate phosphatase